MSNKKAPAFLFKPVSPNQPDDGSGYVVSVAPDRKEDFGVRLCEVLRHGDGNPRWRVRAMEPRDLSRFVELLSFGSKEEAASFAHGLRQAVEEAALARPLPQHVEQYLRGRADDLGKEEQRLLAEFFRVRFERVQLRKFAEDHNLSEVLWRTKDTDHEAVLRKLLEFKVCVKRKEYPLFSEAALYELLGKEDARSVLSLMAKLATAISPKLAQELL